MTSTPPSAVLSRIEELILDVVKQLADHVQPAVSTASDAPQSSNGTIGGVEQTEQASRPVKRRRDAKSKAKPVPLKLGVANEVCFPTKSVVGMRRFAQYLRILELVQSNLRHGMVMTKRDVYYQSTHLFASQQASDRILERIVSFLGCAERGEIGIVASPRGLVSGPLTLGSVPTGELSYQPGVSTLVPTELALQSGWNLKLACALPLGSACQGHLAIVVEKEAVFKVLLQLAHSASTSASGRIQWAKVVLVTGKGYPDHATRALVHLLARATCASGGAVRVVGLFDSDAYGVDIHRQYCSAGTIDWAGVDIEDFLAAPAVHEEEPTLSYPLIPLRNDERIKAVRLLRTLSDSEEDHASRERLTRMLLAGYKVEIEAAYDFVPSPSDSGGSRARGAGLAAYLEQKLFPCAASSP